ncbi:SRPBCC domain-containing protein [Cohnella lupini]|uniref:Uncharacterized protein YndB with AHSA1/START domain n=1 Tax=Cohnella lupini TaxID=1294267 RepID=A0A3D9IXP0_9BACL|nr:SRPBCC domain-containing protein [Cohnella lupini]RED66279.1 uncharacterized protein YndB with AHSA1/START domain [Cohnella lupini]
MSVQVEITRTIRAPRDLVFKAFTDPEQLPHWWGPKGWTFEVSVSDFRPGGVFHYSQKSPEGDLMWVKFLYHEVSKSDKLVYSSFFSDEEGNIVRAPFDPDWPLETLNTLTLAEDEGTTTITIVVALVSPTEVESATFKASHEILNEGFSRTFEQLAEYLSR